jgi:hypothetical protein
MNNSGYVSLEMARRLVDAGVAMETEKWWVRWFGTEHWVLLQYRSTHSDSAPAPSMAELWEWLPEEIDKRILTLEKETSGSVAGYSLSDDWIFNTGKARPAADALGEMAIWLKGREK